MLFSARMLRTRFLFPIAFLFATILAVTVGCQKKPSAATSDNAPVIPVSYMVEREVTDYSDYTGRTDAVLAVNIIARASGYLTRTFFDEGADVKEGDSLFKIDPIPYEISKRSAEAQVKSAEAGIVTAKANIVSSQASVTSAQATVDADNKTPGDTISPVQRITDKATLDSAVAKLDSSRASLTSAYATLESANASLETALVNLGYTDVKAPIGGKTSRYYYTQGNLISANSTLLTTIVANDHMYAYFDIEERVFSKILEEIGKNKSLPKVTVNAQSMRAVAGGMSGLTPLQRSNFPVSMTIEGKSGPPFVGVLDFINNQVNPSTGTIAVRGYFKNPRQNGGVASLTSGMFVRVRLPLGNAHKAQLIIDRAIGSDQGLKFVYVHYLEKDKEGNIVRDKDGNPVHRVAYRRVFPGALQEDGLRVIEPYKPKVGEEMESGVKPDELVVVGGLQQLKPKIKIAPQEMPMPTLAADAVRLKSEGTDSVKLAGDKSKAGEKGGGKSGKK